VSTFEIEVEKMGKIWNLTRSNRIRRVDYEYERCVMASIFLFTEPLCSAKIRISLQRKLEFPVKKFAGIGMA
jgi:hypothetical protein